MAVGESLKTKKNKKKTENNIFVIIVWMCEWLLFGEGELDKKLILCG